jgi:hypothetical protein
VPRDNQDAFIIGDSIILRVPANSSVVVAVGVFLRFIAPRNLPVLD